MGKAVRLLPIHRQGDVFNLVVTLGDFVQRAQTRNVSYRLRALRRGSQKVKRAEGVVEMLHQSTLVVLSLRDFLVLCR